VKQTLFRHQDKLKLVAHCRDNSDRYEQNIIEEYLAYRILNTLTDISYRVRLAHITYVDSEEKYDDRVRYGFFIEHKKSLSRRIDLPLISTERIRTSELAGPYSDLTSLFQFMISNTDFSFIAAPPGETCCHNAILLEGSEGTYLPVPYDFDRTGIVDPPNALPDENLRQKNVRDRLYRGFCVPDQYFTAELEKTRTLRPQLQALFENQNDLSERSRKTALRFLESYYRIIDTPAARERSLKCRNLQ